MLKNEDFIRTFDIVRKTDRDAEAVLISEWLADKKFKSVLDIGCHSSKDEGGYGTQVRERAELYDGIDISHDPRLDGFLDHHFVGNANEHKLQTYEAVLCVSTIEHAGISTYTADVSEEQDKLFKRCLELSTKYVWISFPTGLPYVYPKELSIIDEKRLKRWERLIKNFKVNQRYFYNRWGPQAGSPWVEHTKRDVAVKIPYIDVNGNQSICVMEIEKT